MNYFSLVAFFLTFLFISCQPEPIVVPDYGRKITINGLLTASENVAVYISKSSIITDTNFKMEYYNPLNTAKVLIYENEGYLDSLHSSAYSYYLDWGNQHYSSYQDFLEDHKRAYYPTFYNNEIDFIPGNTYKIEAKELNYNMAFAETTIPFPVAITHLDTQRIALPQNTEEWQSKFKFNCQLTFTDPGETENYYLIYIQRIIYYDSVSMFVDSIDSRIGEVTFRSNDPVLGCFFNTS